MKLKRWRPGPILACVFAAACGNSQDRPSMEGVEMAPAAGHAGNSTKGPTAGKTVAAAGTAGTAGTSAAGASSSASVANRSDEAAGASASGLVAVAMIMSLESSAGTAEAGSGAAGAGGVSASSAGSAATAGSNGSSGSPSTSHGGAAGKAGSAGGTGSGAGFAVVYGHATFTRLASTDVAVKIEVMGCDNGKSYPVHIHEGTSCDSVMSQGGHWGAPKTPEALPMQHAAGAGAAAVVVAGSGGKTAGAAGHEEGHAAGSGGSGAAAASGTAATPLRGEGIPDIDCTGTTGRSYSTRDSLDTSLLWTIGTMDDTDLVGHVVVVHDGADRIACGKIELKK